MKKQVVFWVAIAGIFSFCLVGAANGETNYPTRAIQVINPYAPGGILDVQSRAWASVAQEKLGQPLAVVNKSGATGMIGGKAGATADPDGYTLTVTTGAFTTAIEHDKALGRTPKITRHDFINIVGFSRSPTLVVVPYNSSWKTLDDLIKDCKAKPNHYSFSSGGLYGGSHLPVELLMKAAGIKARHVPYKGGGPALQAIVGGHVDFACQFPPTSIPLYRGKKLRILAVQSQQRLASIPEIPTVVELGLGDEATWVMWVGIGVPKGTPAPIVQQLRDVSADICKDPKFKKMLLDLGGAVDCMIGEDLTKYWDEETERIANLYKEILKEKK